MKKNAIRIACAAASGCWGRLICRGVLVFLGLGFLNVAAWAQDWSYATQIVNAGTRSEGYVGTLMYKQAMVRPKLKTIVTPIGVFEFKSSALPWGAHGWVKRDQMVKPPVSALRFADRSPEEAHWYRGARRQGTPATWSYVPAHGYWVNSGQLEQFADAVLSGEPELTDSPFGSLVPAPQPAGKQREQASQPASPKSAAGFSYLEKLENAGSKSAGVRGELRFQGRLLQSTGGQIHTPIGSFHYVSSEFLWNPQGWFPMAAVPVHSTAERITPAMLQAGRYQGARREGTPETWCYLPLYDTWSDPLQLAMPADVAD